MDFQTIVIHTPQCRAAYNRFFDLFVYHLSSEITFPVAAFFNELPLNPTSNAVRKRLINRGGIVVRAGEIANERDLTSLDSRGRDLKAAFEDDNLGTIVMNLPSSITASSNHTSSSLTVNLSTLILVELYVGGSPPGIERLQQLFKIEAFKDQQVIYYFQGNDKPDQILQLVLTFAEEAFANYTSDLKLAAQTIESRLQVTGPVVDNQISPRLFLALLATEGLCKGGGGGGGGIQYVINRRASDEVCFIQRTDDPPYAGTQPLTNDKYYSIDYASEIRDRAVVQGVCRYPPIGQ